MIHAYVNYPGARAAMHFDPDCAQIRMHGKQNQRVLELDPGSSEFPALDQVRFASTSDLNDLWLVVDLGDLEREQEVVVAALERLAARYTRLGGVRPETHCRCQS